MYKCLHQEADGVDVDLLRHMDTHGYNTCQNEDFSLPKPRMEQLKRTFKYSAAKLWNSLPHYVQNSETLKTFKSIYIRTCFNNNS